MLLTGVPIVHGAERVLELIEDAGAVVVAMENCTGLKPILDDVDLDEPDTLRAIARKYYHLPCSVMTPNTAALRDAPLARGEIPSALRHRTGLAGVPHLRH